MKKHNQEIMSYHKRGHLSCLSDTRFLIKHKKRNNILEIRINIYIYIYIYIYIFIYTIY